MAVGRLSGAPSCFVVVYAVDFVPVPPVPCPRCGHPMFRMYSTREGKAWLGLGACENKSCSAYGAGLIDLEREPPGKRRWWVGVKVLFEPRDLWVGIYWNRRVLFHWQTDIYVCLLPCLPIRLRVVRFPREGESRGVRAAARDSHPSGRRGSGR